LERLPASHTSPSAPRGNPYASLDQGVVNDCSHRRGVGTASARVNAGIHPQATSPGSPRSRSALKHLFPPTACLKKSAEQAAGCFLNETLPLGRSRAHADPSAVTSRPLRDERPAVRPWCGELWRKSQPLSPDANYLNSLTPRPSTSVSSITAWVKQAGARSGFLCAFTLPRFGYAEQLGLGWTRFGWPAIPLKTPVSSSPDREEP